MADAFRSVEVTRVRGGARTTASDRAATEEPLEVRLHGRPFAVIMRTPGADRELAAGFLLAERVLLSADDLGTIEHCTDAGPAKAGPSVRPDSAFAENIVNVTLANGSAATVDRFLADRRQVMSNSSCGLCGRVTIESLRSDVPALDCTWTIDRATLAERGLTATESSRLQALARIPEADFRAYCRSQWDLELADAMAESAASRLIGGDRLA